jgi:flagellar hook-associated protein 1 FlgK
MSLNSIINTAWTGLSTSQAVLRTISSNVSNVNTPGYAREKVHLESLAFSQGGAGVRVSQIERVADRYLEAAAFAATAEHSRFATSAAFHDRLQAIVGQTDSNGFLSTRMDQLFASAAALATQPGDAIQRRTFVAEIERLTEELGRVAQEIQLLRTDASNQLADATRTASGHLERIAALNPQIVREKMLGNPTSGLVEQRNQALKALSELIDITVDDRADGSIRVATGTGLTLLDGAARALDYLSPGSVSADTVFQPVQLFTVDPATDMRIELPQVLEGAIGGGKIQALLALRDQDLPGLAESLGELARVFTTEINRVHNGHVAVPAPASLTGRNSGLLASDAQRFTGQTSFAVLDSAGAVVARTTVDFTALGPTAPLSTVIAQINAGLAGAGTVSLSNGVLEFTAVGANRGVAVVDSETVPSNRAGMGFSQFFGLNDLIRSSGSLVRTTGLAGTDAHGFAPGGTVSLQVRDSFNRVLTSQSITLPTGSVNDILTQLNAPTGLGRYVTFSLDSQGRLSHSANPGFRDLDIHVVSDSTSRGTTNQTLTGFFGIGVGQGPKAAEGLSVRSDVRGDPMRLALARMASTAPIGTVATAIGDARGADGLRDIATRDVTFSAAGNLAGVRTTVLGYAGLLLGDAAQLADRATAGREDAKALKDSVFKRRDDFSGVNLDEELGAMVVFQNSYNASARLITTAREMYDTLLGLVQ